MITNYFSTNGKHIAAENSLFVDKRRGYPSRIYKIIRRYSNSNTIHARWVNASHNFEYIDTFSYNTLSELTFPSIRFIKD